MPRQGGESDKLGNAYEAVWTVDVLLRMASGRYRHLTVEMLGDEASGTEFVATLMSGETEFHSVKRQRSEGEWTLAAVTRPDANGRSVLGDLFAKLQADENTRCVFVSSTGASRLLELRDRAARRANPALFQTEVEQSKKLHAEVTANLVNRLQLNWHALHSLLSRLTLTLIDHQRLVHEVEQRIEALLYRPDGTAVDCEAIRLKLAEFILSRLGSPITPQHVWDYLRCEGCERRDWANDPSILQIVEECNSTFVRQAESDLIGGVSIDRGHARMVVEGLKEAHSAKTMLVAAAAGTGKSCVMGQVVAAVRDSQLPLLSIRLDRAEHIRSSRELGRVLGFPVSPVAALAGIANGGPCVLVIDQLDAASQVSGRYPHLFDVFDELMADAARYPNLRVVVACRAFDLEHDHRLRRFAKELAGARIELSPLSDAEVAAVLARIGLDFSKLTTAQKELLRLPLHLQLFVEGHVDGQPLVNSVGELFDHYWDRKRKLVAQRLGGDSKWNDVNDRLCATMSDRQTLAAPYSAVDDWSDTVAAMISEHVLVRDGQQIRFAHEMLFDYAYARRFVARGGRLRDLLTHSEQHLFRRAQVRQILSYLRQSDSAAYHAELAWVIADPAVRFHIKKVVFRWLGSLPDPTSDEWRILEPFVNDTQISGHVLQPLRNSLPWLDLLCTLGVIAKWLGADSDVDVNRALWFVYLSEAREKRSDRLAELLRPYTGRGEPWPRIFRDFFAFGHAYHSVDMQSLFLSLIDDGTLGTSERHGEHELGGMLRDAADHAPDFVIEAICRWLDARVTSVREATSASILPHNLHDNLLSQQILPNVVAAKPERFARAMLPRVLTIIELTAKTTPLGTLTDETWGFRAYGGGHYVGSAFLESLVTALGILAKQSSDVLDELIEPLTSSKHDTVSYLVLRAWSENPTRYAIQCARYLLDDPRRLNVGYSTFSDGNGRAAVSRLVLSRIAADLSDEMWAQLESAIVGYRTPWEAESNEAGWTEMLLLSAIPPNRISESALARLIALKEKFPGAELGLPSRPTFAIRAVGSPIPPETASNFSDDEWLEAMNRYDKEWGDPGLDWDKGTAVELSRVLEQQVLKERNRFALLAEHMADEVHRYYFDAILNGLCRNQDGTFPKTDSESAPTLADAEDILSVLRRVHRIPNRPCGRAICEAFERLAHSSLTDADLDILIHYAIADPDPSSDTWLPSVDRESAAYGGDAHMAGYNSVRGAAARAIARLLFADYRRSRLLLPVLEQMARDPCLSVRTCVLEALMPILNHDRDKAVNLFIAAVTDADSIFGEQPFEDFIYYAAQSHYAELRSIITRALASSDDEAVSAAARQVCVHALGQQIAEFDAEQVRQGTPVMRKAAAGVYAQNLADDEVGSLCATYLEQMFHDDDPDVRAAAADCFRSLTDEQLDRFQGLIRHYADSLAYPASHDDLLYRLEHTSWQVPAIAIQLAERFLERAGKDAGDFSTAAAGMASSVSKLVIRVYAQATDDQTRIACLNLIDAMERLGFYGIDSELGKHDRM